jgi:RHS repeat-associated protein
VVTTYTYDARDRPLSVVHRNAANLVLASRTYVRAPGGEPTRITKEDGSYVEVGYDGALRILSERYYEADGELEQELGYTYDADGNRLTKTVDGVVSTYAYAAGARLTGITTAGITEGRTTDNGGRETALALMSHQLALTYDSDDHVTRVVDGANTADFAFDAAGRRVAVTSSGTTKRFLTAPNAGDGYDSPQAVTDASGALIASYVFAGETPLAKSTASGTQYYLTDALGSVIATSSGTGTLLAALDYDAFGNERTSGTLASDTHGDFRLHGMWKDPSGLYFVRARVYDAEAGRFTSRDPARGWPERPNTYLAYSFAANAPSVFRDPSGWSTITETGARLAGISVFATRASASLAAFSATAARFVQTHGVRSYQNLRNAVDALKNSGAIDKAEKLHVHHLIPQRFANLFQVNANDMLAIVLRPEEHQVFTSFWRDKIPYGSGTVGATRELVIEVARQAYANYPEILRALSILE